MKHRETVKIHPVSEKNENIEMFKNKIKHTILKCINEWLLTCLFKNIIRQRFTYNKMMTNNLYKNFN